MEILKSERYEIASEEDVVRIRRAVKNQASEMGFGALDQTKLMTAVSEIVRNALKYGGGGHSEVERVREGFKDALRIHVKDEGPGIPDVEEALRDGFTSGGGMGLGLGGTRRLVDEFEIDTVVGSGTRVTFLLWK